MRTMTSLCLPAMLHTAATSLVNENNVNRAPRRHQTRLRIVNRVHESTVAPVTGWFVDENKQQTPSIHAPARSSACCSMALWCCCGNSKHKINPW
uniref:Putative secreted peptide n=1 Tax=Anopheles braziliensis TaxID=58242 RepID=A0A2M3ZV90_9DIPT